MANTEKNWGERTGENVRNVGIVGGIIGLIAMAAEAPLGGTIFVASAGLGVSGEIFRRVTRKNQG